MAGTVTITGQTGPARQLTAVTYTFVKSVSINFDKNIVTLVLSTDQILDVDVAPATTVTATKSGANWTLVIS